MLEKNRTFDTNRVLWYNHESLPGIRLETNDIHMHSEFDDTLMNDMNEVDVNEDEVEEDAAGAGTESELEVEDDEDEEDDDDDDFEDDDTR